jgi:2-acylglycerol O-acyltransferase 2
MHVPMQRRLQTAAVLTWALLIPLSLALFLYLRHASRWRRVPHRNRPARVTTGRPSSAPALRPFITIYSIWAFGIDSSPRTGGRPSRRFRNLVFWKYFAQYYPQELVKVRGVVESHPVSIPQSQTTTF